MSYRPENRWINHISKYYGIDLIYHKMIYFKYISFNISTNKYRNNTKNWIFFSRNNTESWIFYSRNNTESWVFLKNSHNWNWYISFKYSTMYCLLDLIRSKYPLISDLHNFCIEILTTGHGHTSLTTSQSIPGIFYIWNLD